MATRLYVENGVGRRVVEAINLFTQNHGCVATMQHDLHPQMQIPQHGDEWWIEEAAAEGYVILTDDLGIFRSASERATVARTAARIIGYARADTTGWQKVGGLASHWNRIEEQLQEPGPWILQVYAGPTTAKLLLS